MKNAELAQLLYDIADMLEMQNVDFKPAAYRKAARSVENLSEDIEELARTGGRKALMKIPGIGVGIAEKIEEYLSRGKLGYYNELKEKFPAHITKLMNVPGIGPKRIRVLNDKLKVASVEELEAAARAHRICKLKGFGETSESDILRGIETFRKGRERTLLGYALPEGLEIESRLKKQPEVIQVSLAGSLRRRKETIGDIDVLASCKGTSAARGIMKFFTSMPGVANVLASGETKASVILRTGIQVDLRVVNENSFGAALQYFTGSKEHNVAVRALAISRGLKLNEYGVYTKKGRRLAGKTEEEVYRCIGLPYIQSEIRENSGEVEAALRHQLPDLVKYDNIRGDFHAHTVKSDGGNKINEMVSAAKNLGYGYIAITDHSRSERIANGLQIEEMEEWLKEIRAFARKERGINVLAGSEVDILPNGDLDYPDDLLSKMDIVVCSIHSRFRLTRQEMTSRILTAMENKYMDILAHPTGRKIGGREPIDFDLKKVFATAAAKGILLEINAYPDRSDLSDVLARQAGEAGCSFAIDTDAHTAEQLRFMGLGVSIARRAWLSADKIANTTPFSELSKFSKRLKFHP